MSYDVRAVEQRWLSYLKRHPIRTKSGHSGKKYYCLDMFPYPSGSGLHVGHWKGYVLSDVYARIKLLLGYNVLHPMGWDAFGLPAENDAIKKGIQPQVSTARNIAHFREQMDEIGAIYDWSKEINTTDPSYYKWTQWIFIQMFKAGLAYQKDAPINWCPSCLTGLANEEVVDGTCERCGTPVEQKKIRQWILAISKYAEKLLDGLDHLDWPEKVKLMQRNWIGKSEGLIFTAPVKDMDITIQTFSAHYEMCYADTFVVIAPDHPLLPTLIADIPNKTEIESVCADILQKRTSKDYDALAEPEGIFTGRYIIDPLGNGELPIWVANFALADYGTGIIKCSAHDERDFNFAKKYGIKLKIAMVPEDPELAKKVRNFEVCFTDTQRGILLEPAEFAGKNATASRAAITKYLVDRGFAVKKTTYKLRDWVFSRQRYWGEPIPIIHCAQCGPVAVPEDQLPVVLPEVEHYQPTGTGESPLAAIPEWVNTICPQCKGPGKRETNTMPQWAGSSWYFLRYPNPHLTDKPFDQADMDYWLPVDLYVGGIEHAILHLLYARFYVKFLHDAGYLSFDEPFKQLFNQGMVLRYSEKTGLVEKMSKSKGNVVNPDDIVKEYGSDVLRMYILFMGPPELDCEWQDSGLDGIKRFLQRVWNFFTDSKHRLTSGEQEQTAVTQSVHRCIAQVQERLDRFKPNTAVSALMEWLNKAIAEQYVLSDQSIEAILVLISVMSPCISQELLDQLLHKKWIECSWPQYDPAMLQEDTVTIILQVNGKMRGSLVVDRTISKEELESRARQEIHKWLEGATIQHIVHVPHKLINFVI